MRTQNERNLIEQATKTLVKLDQFLIQGSRVLLALEALVRVTTDKVRDA
jgi:hypothetical protein